MINQNHDEDLDSNSSQPKETITRITGMYKDWFLDYASYVILERAVPAIEDGFKPVQRRIMHSMKDLDDGRYNKVANIVGHTMQYHPHGDASIADAMVQIGQKDLLIDTQGNWGNILTGDSAAASRYIEARLSKFALDVVYNPKITDWQASYDGRRKEPINLPVMFPLLLAQGGEGIAVGLSTKILPHNFIELIDASIKCLQNKPFTILPDFPTAGIADTSNYNDGNRGGRIRVRAKIKQHDKHTLVINELPFGTTTTSLIDSILKANDKGKIKIKKIEDNTASHVEILVHLPSGISPDKTIDALYAFTSCETSISPLGCVIEDNKPLFIGVSEILKRSTENTVSLLKQELEINLNDLQEQWHFASLERIFIEHKIYRDIEDQETWEGVISAIRLGLRPHIAFLKRPVEDDDITRLTEIKIKRISKFDIDKAQQKIEALEQGIEAVKHNLNNLIDYAISYFERLKKDYGEGKERKTELRLFDDVDATKVIIRNTKLYVNREEGFVGTSLKRHEYVCDCSDIDDIIVFSKSGQMSVTKVGSKNFVFKDILHVAVFKKKDTRTVYNMIYTDGKTGPTYIKRFAVSGVTRDRVYDLANGNKDTTCHYFSSNPNGEAEIVTIFLRQQGSVKKLKWDIDFANILIKGRSVRGNLVTKYKVKRVDLKEKGVSTLKPRKIWFDTTVNRLNTEERGRLLGAFKGDDALLVITQSGTIKTMIPDLNMHFDNDVLIMEKWIPEKPISVIYFNGDKNTYYVKRFLVEQLGKVESFIPDFKGSKLKIVSTDWKPVVDIVFSKPPHKGRGENTVVNIEAFMSIKKIAAFGNQLSRYEIKDIILLDSIPYEEQINEESQENDLKDDISDKSKGDENQITLF